MLLLLLLRVVDIVQSCRVTTLFTFTFLILVVMASIVIVVVVTVAVATVATVVTRCRQFPALCPRLFRFLGHLKKEMRKRENKRDN